MALSREQSIQQYGTEAYTGWGETEARYDAREHPEKLNTYKEPSQNVQSAQDYANAFIEVQQKQIQEETKWVDQYVKDNPFVFDEALAKKAATAEYEPYYSELLKDYLADINQKRSTVQDETKLLRQLRQLDVGEKTRAYKYAIENAEKGHAGRGLFSSGMRARDVGKREIEYKTGMEEATGRYEAGEVGLEREAEGLGRSEFQKRRDVFGGEEALGGIAGLGDRGGAYQTSVESGILQRKGEAEKGYYAPFVQSYARRFPTGSNALAGYLPPEYLRY